MATIAIPELLSKIPAAAATVVLTAYLGAQTLPATWIAADLLDDIVRQVYPRFGLRLQEVLDDEGFSRGALSLGTCSRCTEDSRFNARSKGAAG